jgi:hypothetical protein
MSEIRDTSLRGKVTGLDRWSAKLENSGPASQSRAVHPNWVAEISAESVYQHFVFVELEDNVWQPPLLLPLQGIAIRATGTLTPRRRGEGGGREERVASG